MIRIFDGARYPAWVLKWQDTEYFIQKVEEHAKDIGRLQDAFWEVHREVEKLFGEGNAPIKNYDTYRVLKNRIMKKNAIC